MRTFFAAALAATAFMSIVSTASAAPRYASPSSADTSGSCDSTAPCRLDWAVGGASNGEIVQLLPGDYAVSYPVAATASITVTADPAKPRPRLLGDALRTAPTISLGLGGTLSHVYAEAATNQPAVSTKSVLVEDVIAYSQGASAIVAKAGSAAVIRDSVAQTAAGAPALKLTDNQITGSLDVVNVTAVANAIGSTGLENGSGGPVTITNTIARGAAADITKFGIVADATVTYSSFRPAASTGVSAGPGNRDADPVFVNLTGGVFRQVAGSPTIDAGSGAAANLGSFDPDGRARIIGSAPDIGAYEFDPSTTGTNGGKTDGTGTTGTGTTGTDPGRDAGRTSVLPPAAPPVLGRSVSVGTASGTVTVVLPGSSQPLPLDRASSVPVGSVIDATDGVVTLTSVADAQGRRQTGRFWGGAFKVTQRNRGDLYTELRLVGRLTCGVRGKVVAAGRRARRLWGRDNHGRFRTRGRRGQATVRGTRWLTEDRCDGTLFRVTQGAVVVRDFGRRKNVKLTRGERYLARAAR